MRCVYCNTGVADGMRFCPNCGNPMDSQPQPQQGQYQQPPQSQYQEPQQGQYQQPPQGQYQQPQQEESQPSQTGVVLKLVEYLFYILAAADFFLGTFGIVDITGFKYSPFVFAVIGAVIGQYVKKKYGIVDDDDNE